MLPRLLARSWPELPLEVPSVSKKSRGSSLLTGFYVPKNFITHAALLRQTFVHCAIFPTAASRRSLGRISVPVWPNTLSGRLPIEALVSHYFTNKLIGRGPLLKRLLVKKKLSSLYHAILGQHSVLAPRWRGYPQFESRLPTCYSPVCHSTCSTEAELSRSTCMYEARRQRSF